MTEFEGIILALIDAHDGEWGWYQLDRGLTARGMEYRPDLLEVIAQLETQGMLRLERRDELPQARYWITAAGRAAVEGCDGME